MSVFTEPTFTDDCRHAVQELRRALLSLYRHAGADPGKPQEVSRRFGLNKNLTWKIARILSSDDAFAAVSHVPGAAGVEIVLAAFADAQAPPEAIAAVREASVRYDQMIERHAGDRATLELLIDGMGSERPLEVSRKIAFRGNSGVWGLQARARMTSQFVAPNRDDPTRLDLALVGGFVGLCRLRPVARWPLFYVTSYNDDRSTPGPTTRERIELGGGDPFLLESFCEGSLSIETDSIELGERYMLTEGPVGRAGAASCFFGFIDRATVPRARDGHNTYGEFASTVAVPAETLQFDLFVHRDIEEAMHPEVLLFGQLWGSRPATGPHEPLPCAERIHNLGFGAPPATPITPRYEEIVNTVLDRAGWQLDDFCCLRLVMDYPPMPSTTMLRYSLPEA